MFHRREYIRRKVLVHLRRWILLSELPLQCPSRAHGLPKQNGCLVLSDKRGFQDPPTSLLDDNICFARNGHKTVVSIERIPKYNELGPILLSTTGSNATQLEETARNRPTVEIHLNCSRQKQQ